ncbi:MAG: MFS transporter, partial [Leptospira sp.]|nr:MFS transporter [Leptospira sp.]
ALGLSYLLVVVTGPIFGAITDYTARKKLFLFISYVGCVITTASLWFVLEPGMIFLGVLLIILSNFFFASGENFASSFLPFLGPKEDLGKISGYAWSIGYLGGIASVALVKTLGEVNPDNFERLRLVGPYTGAFFLLAGIPTFLLLREYAVPEIKTSKDSYIVIGFKRLYTTIKSISDFRDLAVYLVSLFFAMAALNIAVSFAFIYGNQEIKTASEHEVWMFLLIQIFAAGGALAFGYLQDRIGAKVTFNMTLVIWIAGLLLIYEIENLTGFVNSVLGSSFTKQWVFVLTHNFLRIFV